MLHDMPRDGDEEVAPSIGVFHLVEDDAEVDHSGATHGNSEARGDIVDVKQGGGEEVAEATLLIVIALNRNLTDEVQTQPADIAGDDGSRYEVERRQVDRCDGSCSCQ